MICMDVKVNGGRGQATKHGGREPLELRAAFGLSATTRGGRGGTPLPSRSGQSIEDPGARVGYEGALGGLRRQGCVGVMRATSEYWAVRRSGRDEGDSLQQQSCIAAVPEDWAVRQSGREGGGGRSGQDQVPCLWPSGFRPNSWWTQPEESEQPPRQQDKECRAEVRFTDLGLIVAKRLVTHRWKSPDPPSVQAWRRSLEVWAGAEGIALVREEVLGLRQFPLSANWEGLLLRLRNMGVCPVEEGLD
ncbi:hypothetical protein NDU88_002885 [Pleurodeles waltl]|uniref:Uncharacterized protein n=1 Tax=Pleurodeles waltl TaxID=8319 RepID=A0AAV7P9K8_PLEWA|nr:hypothetical protein NDU88_002885 [Pleurodeles waltl]